MKQLPLPRETFRIYPDVPSSRYFLVHVARSKGWMRREIKRTCGSCSPKAIAHCAGTRGTGRYKPMLGFVFFCKEYFGSGIVAHELAHAAFRVAQVDKRWPRLRTTKQVSRRDTEERYAETVGNLSRTFWQQAYDTGTVK